MIVKNWKYYQKKDDIGLLKITKNQFMTGNIMGIIAEKKVMKNEKNNLLNAKSYNYPVRVKFVEAYNGENYNETVKDIHSNLSLLEQDGCRFVITTGGKLGVFDKEFHKSDMLTISSPLLFLDFAAISIPSSKVVCIVNELAVEENVQILEIMGFDENMIAKCIFTDLMQERFFDSKKNEIVGAKEIIGAYIWDDREDYHEFLEAHDVPIYSILKVANFIKEVVMQMPYEGVI